MNSLETLIKIFERFPGIGPRQAGRFVQFLLRASPSLRKELAEAVRNLAFEVHQCASCMRFTADSNQTCRYCTDPERDSSLLAVVASDADLAALERSGYRGRYFVLGGTLSLATEHADGLRLNDLKKKVTSNGFSEVILAFPANPEGDFTSSYVRTEIESASTKTVLKITSLGRGLSTGSELEYADRDTILSALNGRH